MFANTLVPRASRIERAGLLLTVALLLFAGIAALVTQTGGTTSVAEGPMAVQPADRLTALHRLSARERDGRVLVRLADAGFRHVVIDPADPRVLHVVVPHGMKPIDCNLIAAQVRVLAQNASAVRLVATGSMYVPAASARGAHGGTTCVQAGTAMVPVRLRAPLGDRQVFSGNGSQSVRVTRSGD